MPKIKYINPRRPVKRDPVMDTIRRYESARGYTSKDLGEKLGLSPQSIRAKMSRGSESFTISDLKAWCDALKIPVDEISADISSLLK